MTKPIRKPKYVWEIVLWRRGEPRVYGRYFTKKEANEDLKILRKAYSEYDEQLAASIRDGNSGWEIRKEGFGRDLFAEHLIEWYKEKNEKE